jgi:hypothetical protein
MVTLAAAQILGGLVGVVVANLMFSEPAASLSTTERGGPGRWAITEENRHELDNI